jgi:hypothetical protein
VKITRIELWVTEGRPLGSDFTGVLDICKGWFCLRELPYCSAQRPDIDFERVIHSTIKADEDENPSERLNEKQKDLRSHLWSLWSMI